MNEPVSEEIFIQYMWSILIVLLSIFIFTMLIFFFLVTSARADFPADVQTLRANTAHWAPIHCQALSSPSWDTRVDADYYAGWYGYEYASKLLSDSSLIACSQKARSVYIDDYIAGDYTGVPGYWNFAIPPLSQSEIFELSTKAAYARMEASGEDIRDVGLSREVSYAIVSYVESERGGAPRNALFANRVDAAFHHLDMWFVLETAPYVRPFMVALTSRALIWANQIQPDSRTLPALKRAADTMWDTLWVPTSWAFRYTDRDVPSGGTEPSPDLNLLVAPLYSWLYAQTGEVKYRDRFDQIFHGGVTYAFLGNPKQFNQQLFWIGSGLDWRDANSPSPTPTGTPTPSPTRTPLPTPTPTVTATASPTATVDPCAGCPEVVRDVKRKINMSYRGCYKLCQYR